MHSRTFVVRHTLDGPDFQRNYFARASTHVRCSGLCARLPSPANFCLLAKPCVVFENVTDLLKGDTQRQIRPTLNEGFLLCFSELLDEEEDGGQPGLQNARGDATSQCELFR